MSNTESPHPPTSTRAQALLLDFLSDHDAACPMCGYNLKGLTRPVCPECKQDLVITVGVTRLRLGWLLVALVPGIFAGIAACFVAIPATGAYFEDGVFFPPFVGAILFGWCSGIFAIILAIKHRSFMGQSRKRQKWFALLVWFAHFAAFVGLLISVAPYWD